MRRSQAYLDRNAQQVRDESQDDLVALARGLLLSVLEYHEAEAVDLPLPYLRECTADFASTRQLGEGAFGQVFKAVDAVTGVTFAVKRLDRAFLAPHADPTARAAQLRAAAREVEVLSRFRHPHIVRLLGYAFAADGDRCLVYPLLAGGALDAALRDEARAADLTWRVRLRIAAGLAKALNYLHRGGSGATCYHRDVKSANVCLTAELTPQLIDCGLAKYVPDDAPAATSTGGRFGTPGYQCPLYVDDGKFDSKSEAYSLGIVLVELLVGEVQNERRSLYRVFVLDEEEELSGTRDRRAGEWPMEMVAGLVEVILACLAIKRRERFDTHAAMERLMTLERTHCQQPAEEAQLQAVRAELERLRKEAEEAGVQAGEQLHTCLVCFDNFPLARGVECVAAVDAHFMCADCLEGYVREATSDGNLSCLEVDGRWQGIRCPGVQGCSAQPFTERALAVQLSDDTFARLVAARVKIAEKRRNLELEATFEARVQAAAANNDRGLRVRNHIVERILNLACPHCKQVLNDSDFDYKHNCCALRCGSCSTSFCAFCLKDCGIIQRPHDVGTAANQHVLQCKHNVNRVLFVSSKEEFEAIQRQRRKRDLESYLDTLSPEDAQRARHDCDSDLRAHGLV